jgi:hypothetical protein
MQNATKKAIKSIQGIVFEKLLVVAHPTNIADFMIEVNEFKVGFFIVFVCFKRVVNIFQRRHKTAHCIMDIMDIMISVRPMGLKSRQYKNTGFICSFLVNIFHFTNC